ncbi:MAG: SIMPL domain-containing protein [Anaerolineales bacterium]|nr:SIMPL domain-containing protein [Anaerolineales bacterium]
MRNKLTHLMYILIVAVLLSGCAGVALAQSATPTVEAAPADKPVTRTITVTGSGKALLTPNIAYINIGVHTEEMTAVSAVKANSQLADKVIAALKSFGIDEKDIQTTNFSIYPQPQYDAEGKPTGEIKYIVDNTVYVTVRDLTKIGELLDAAVEAGANNISGIQFDVADKSKALTAARQAAVENARLVAEELVSAAGVTLGAVQTINVYGDTSPMPVMYDMAMVKSVEASSVPVSPGQMTITVQVNIVYEIR